MKSIISFLLLFPANFLNAQDFEFVNSIAIEEPTEVSIDRAGNIYFATYNGDIIRYSSNLQNEVFFSPSNPNTVTILEAWQGLRLFAFHRDLQQYRLINRNLSLHEDYQFPKDILGFAEIATPSFDNNIWAVDQVDFSLIKYDIVSRSLRTRVPLNQILDPDNSELLFMKEYQNRLFLSTRDQGILIFDNLGTYVSKFEYKGVSYFSFFGDKLYFLENETIVEVDLYNDKIKKRRLPGDRAWLFVVVYNDLIYLFAKEKIACYK